MQEEETQQKMTEAQMERVAAVFKVLSETARLKLVSSLMGGSRTVSELVELSALKQSNVSKHLKILADAGLISKRKEGNFVRYEISEPKLYALCGLMCAQVEESAQASLDALS